MELSKELKAEVRVQLEVAHERLLAAELRALDEQFATWKAGEIDAFELTEKIHVFHNGPSRELFNRFGNRGIGTIMIAGLVVDGVLSEGEFSAPLREALLPQIEHIRAWRAEHCD